MRERLESIDGTLELDAAPGAGTTLWARVPAAALARLGAAGAAPA
jgi:signal transduction histidine kinase